MYTSYVVRIEKTSVNEGIFELGCFYVSQCVVVTSRSELRSSSYLVMTLCYVLLTIITFL